MNIIKSTAFVLVVFLFGCGESQQNHSNDLSVMASDKPVLFLPDVIKSNWNVRDLTLTDENNEVYYTLVAPKNKFSVIMTSKKLNNTWEEAEIASFSGQYSDLEPALSPDGTKLFFASNRPDSIGGDPKDYDIWMVERISNGWSTPINLGEKVNTAGNEFFPSVGSSGNLYFTAEYADSKGREDIYVSEYKDGMYQKPYSLSEAINSKTWEFNAFVSADESTLVFTSYGREDDLGGGDLYISKKVNGSWTPAQNLGDEINSVALDYCPFLSSDGQLLYFTSERTEIKPYYVNGLTAVELDALLDSPFNGKGNLYWVQLNE